MYQSVTKKDLEEIRVVAIAYWKASTHEFKEAFITELERGGLFIGDDAIKNRKFNDTIDHEFLGPTTIELRNPSETTLLSGDAIQIGSWHLEYEDSEYILKRYGAHDPDAMAIFNFILHLKRDKTGWLAVKNSYEHVRVSHGNSI